MKNPTAVLYRETCCATLVVWGGSGIWLFSGEESLFINKRPVLPQHASNPILAFRVSVLVDLILSSQKTPERSVTALWSLRAHLFATYFLFVVCASGTSGEKRATNSIGLSRSGNFGLSRLWPAGFLNGKPVEHNTFGIQWYYTILYIRYICPINNVSRLGLRCFPEHFLSEA